MDLTLTTPALFFPAISLLMLAYTNRFIALANVIRRLHADEKISPDPRNHAQILNLRKRLRLIQHMQELGVASFLSCVLCMGALFLGYRSAAQGLFIFSMSLFCISLIISIFEIHISSQALDIRLSDMEQRGS